MTPRALDDPRIRQLLDGELTLADLPAELRPAAEAMLRRLRLERAPVPAFSPWFDQRVMAAVRRRPLPGRGGPLAWLRQRLELPRWALLAGGAAALLLALAVAWSRPGPVAVAGAASDSVYVRFVLYAPGVHQVALAGSFNEWDPARSPLVPGASPGVWTTTVALPPGQHFYSFVLDGRQWVPDPAAPTVDDGFGRRNSVMTVAPPGRRLS